MSRDPAGNPTGPVRALVWGSVIAAVYFGAARLGLVLATIHGSVSPVWPATGVAIGALAVGGVRWWPAVWIGAFAANVVGDLPWWVAGLIAAGNTGEAFVGAWLLAWTRARIARSPLAGEAAGCGLASLVAPAISAINGVVALGLAGQVREGMALSVLGTWWVGDALGALTLVPLVVALARVREGTRPRPVRIAVSILLAAGVAGAVFYLPWGGRLLFALFPVLFLAVCLSGELGVKLAGIVVAATGIAASFAGLGPFVTASFNDNLLFLQLFLASVATAALVLPIFARAGSLWLAGLILLAGWTISGMLFARMHAERLAADGGRLDAMAAETERALRQRMDASLEVLLAGAALHAASQNVDRHEWEAFVNAFNLPGRLPGLNALGVARRVRADEVASFVEARRREGVPDFQVRVVQDGVDSPGREHYLIAFVEPLEPNRYALGLDMSSEAIRRQAAEESRDTGQSRASARISLTDARVGNRAGFIVFHPIYRKGAPVSTVPERRDALTGWIVAPIFSSDFFRSVAIAPELELAVFDGRSTDPAMLLYASADSPGRPRGFDKVTTVELAGNLFTLAWRRGAGFPAASPVAAVVTASSLALLMLLLAGLVTNLRVVGRQAREIAAARTAELTAAQATLERINRLQHAVLDGTVYSIISTDVGGTIRIFNRGAEQLLGYRRDEMIGRQTPVIIHLAEEVEMRALELAAELGRPIAPGFEVFVARAALGEVEQREWTYVRRDGSRLPVLLSVTALRDGAGTITGYLGIAHDLTERRGLERSLRLEQQRLRLANDAAGIGVWEWDIAAGTLTWDATMFALYGLTPTVGGRVTYDDWRHLVHPDDLLAQEAALKETVRRAGRGQREFRIIRGADDDVRYISASELAITGPDGRTVRMVGVNRDITERRRAMEQLRQSQVRLASIFGAVSEGLVLHGPDGRILECNSAACRLLGLTREQMEGRTSLDPSWRTLREDGRPFPGDEHPAMVTLRTGEPMRDVIMGVTRPNGAVVWISINTAPIGDPATGIQAVVSSFSDVSARRQIAHDLARARDEALEASRLKSEFLATMSHEIRTPMNGIIGTIELLLGTPLDPTQHEMARLVQGSAENLLEIINDILDFSRIEAGRLRLDAEPFEVLPLLEQSAGLLAGRAQRKGLEFVLDVAPSLSAEVLVGDAGRIRQVLLNIVGNAVKFTERGEVVVAAAVRPASAGRGVLRVEVRDTGIGIAPEFRGRLFQAFTQVDSSATRRFGGTGLGLAISRQLVDLMGGRLDYSSEAGRGSTFWIEIELPRCPGEPPAGEDADLSVLVVDDNATARAVLVGQLRALGVEAAGVADAAGALAALAPGATGPGRRRVVLVDRWMPGTDGLGLARQIRADRTLDDVSLILAGPVEGAGAIGTEGAWFSASLTKPVRPSQLRVALSRARHASSGAAAVPATAREARPAAGSPGAGLRVLLAEDNPANQLVARMVLESLGHRVDVAENGRVALERLAEMRYDVVFMDCQMPELDGFEATRRMRSGTLPGVDPRQPVIALTAFAMERDRDECRAAGMDDYVSKPVRAADVRAVLERCGLVAPGAGPGANGTGPGDGVHGPGAAQRDEPLLDDGFLDTLRALPGREGPSLLAEVVDLHQRETAARLAELPGLLAAGDHAGVARVAHLLAGSSANAGAPRARAAFAAVEIAVREGALAEVPARLEYARQVWQDLRAELVRRGLLSP